MEELRERRKKRKVKRKLKMSVKIALGILAVAAVALIFTVVVRGVYRNYYGKMNYQETTVRTDFARSMRRVLEGDMRSLMHAEYVYNILLVGHDSRKEDQIRHSDTMILVSINKNTEEIIMTSLMRDCWVHIPGYGPERLNDSFELGGPSLLMETIETNFHIRVDRYVAISFFAFMDVVDALGGVEMTITDAEVENMLYYFHNEINPMLGRPKDTDVIEKGGTYVLNGAQTLAYVRCRYLEGGDFGRTERQRKVLNVLFERFKDCNVGELMEVMEVVLPNVTTDIGEDELLTLMTELVTMYKDYEIVQYHVPYEGTYDNWIHDMTGEEKNVLSIDVELNSQYMIRDIYGVDFTEEEL